MYLVVPAALLVLSFQFFSTYSRLVAIFKWLTLALFAYVITAFVAHPAGSDVLRGTFVPHIEPSSDFITALVAVLGTTISPYLFFWQASSEVDEMEAAGLTTERSRHGVKDRELAAARIDVLVGMGYSQIVMYCIIVTSAAVLGARGHTDNLLDCNTAMCVELEPRIIDGCAPPIEVARPRPRRPEDQRKKGAKCAHRKQDQPDGVDVHAPCVGGRVHGKREHGAHGDKENSDSESHCIYPCGLFATRTPPAFVAPTLTGFT